MSDAHYRSLFKQLDDFLDTYVREEERKESCCDDERNIIIGLYWGLILIMRSLRYNET